MNIYIGNLSFNISENELRTLFAEYGQVTSVKIIQDKFTGKSKGFAFVEMSTKEEGETAIKALSGKEIGGRALTVDEARPANNSNNLRSPRRRNSRY